MHQRFLFSDFVLDTSTRTLIRSGQPVVVQGQVFDLLHYLVRHPGEVISKDQLFKQVWNNPFLGDAVIAQAVKKARHALGDDGRRQQMIRTVHGRGISFVPEVQTQTVDRTPATTTRKPLRWSVIIAATALILLTLGVWLLTKPSNPSLANQSLAVFSFENVNGEEALDWLEVGLAQTVSVLLDQAGGLRVLGPLHTDELPNGARRDQLGFLGVASSLDASVEQKEGQFELRWQLTPAEDVDEPVQGLVVSADASQLARQLADAVLSELAGRPDVPLPSQPLLEDALASELYSRGVRALYMNQYEPARALLQAAIMREPDSVPLRIALLQASVDYNDIQQSIKSVRTMLDDVIADNPVAAARLMVIIGVQLWNTGQIDASSDILQEGLQLLEGIDAKSVRAATLNALALSQRSQLEFDTAWDNVSRAELMFRELNDPYHLSLVLTNMGYLAEDMGRILQAGELHREALEIRERYRFPELIAASQYGLARIERRSGNFAAAERLLEQSLATVTSLEMPFDTFDNLEELAEVKMRQQQFLQAAQALDQAERIAAESEDALGQTWAKQVQVRLELMKEDISKTSFERLEQVRQSLLDMGEYQEFFIASLELAELNIHGPAPAEQAIAGSQAVLAEISDSPARADPVLSLRYDAVAARLLARQGSHEQAIQTWQRLVRQARSIGVVDLEAEYAIALGQLALTLGDIELAHSMLAIASRWSPDYFRTVRLAERLAALET